MGRSCSPQTLRWAGARPRPSVLFHAATPGGVEKYAASGRILAPVRGFDDSGAAAEWADKMKRPHLLAIWVRDPHLLTDHHLYPVGAAWWTPHDVTVWAELTRCDGCNGFTRPCQCDAVNLLGRILSGDHAAGTPTTMEKP